MLWTIGYLSFMISVISYALIGTIFLILLILSFLLNIVDTILFIFDNSNPPLY